MIYTSSSKIEEHGGFADEDIHVALLIANPGLKPSAVFTSVQTTQIAPTILRLLGLNPNGLKAVQMEGTPVLPGLGVIANGQNSQ